MIEFIMRENIRPIMRPFPGAPGHAGNNNTL